MSGPLNMSAIKRAHSNFITAHNRELKIELEAAKNVGLTHVHEHPEFKPRTGALQKATRGTVVLRRGGGVVRLSNAKKYANAIDLGAKAHVIRRRKANALRFFIGGRVVFAQRVNHPGNRAYRFLYNATDAAGRSFARNMNEAMTKIARKF